MKANNENSSEKIGELLNGCSRPLILSHIRPDGDAVGSMIGLSLALQSKGKKPLMVITDGIPKKFRFLKGVDKIERKINGKNDLVIALDCADLHRVGYPTELPDIDVNIDHHVTNGRYGKANLVCPERPATSAILGEYLPTWDFDISPEIAEALLMGIITDTIGFRTSNVAPTDLRLSADLMEKGANLQSIYYQSLIEQSLPASIIWGNALARIQYEDNLAWTTITLEDRKRAKYQGRDDADLTNLLQSLENIDLAILFNEEEGNSVKISWRSKGRFDVSKIAVSFNGGGHPPAAGAEVPGSLESVMELIVGETKKFMKGIN